MVEISVIRERLTQAAQSIRAVTRSLGGARESQESTQKALLALSEVLDLVYQLREQISWMNEKWVVAPARLCSLDELLSAFESTIRVIEINFQPGGVSSRASRKGLLERTFLPRLEQYKMAFLVAMQPESREKSLTEQHLKNSIRLRRALEPVAHNHVIPTEDSFQSIASQIASKSALSLANISHQRQKETCEWIFHDEKYKSWLCGNYRTLYCVGLPGVGKTFLASTVIENLQNTFTLPGVAVVFLFCEDEKEDDQASPLNMLSSVLGQLVCRRGCASYVTASLYQSEALAQQKVSAKDYQNAIRAEVNHFSKVLFVIDGLDLFPGKDRILNRFQKLPEHSQFLITLREKPDKDESISVMASRKDLETYIDARISQESCLNSLLKQYAPEYQLKEAIIQQVIEKSHRVFLLARMHMDLISRCGDASVLQTALLHLPETLNDAYAESMKQLASQNLYASRCIYWTLYAYRPLTVTELKAAVFFEPQNGTAQKGPTSFEKILHVETAGLLTIDPMTTTVHLVHKTAAEYLTGATARVFFPTSRKHIAETCLTVIASDEVVDDCYISNGTTPRNSSSSLLSYAATYWGGSTLLSWRRPPVIDELASEETKIPSQLGLGKYCPDWSALHVLAYFGITTKVPRLIEKGADVNAQDNSMGIAPLHCAVYRGNEEMVELLLDFGADINAICKDGSTVMHLAAERGQRRVMKLLLAQRANSRTANRQGVTPLQLAVGTAYDESTVPMLIKSRSDIDAKNVFTGNTTLHVAVELKRARILLFLLERGATMNLAAKLDNCEAISLLLERGAKVEVCSMFGSRALHIAASAGNWIAFDLLLSGGADINAWNSDGESLLHEQARKATSTSVAAHLLEQGAGIETQTSQGYTPLQCAAMSGNKTMFFFLFEHGAEVDVLTAKEETLLHLTPPVSQDCLDILHMLLQMGLDVEAVSINGWTPLHQTIFVGTGSPDIEFDKTSEYIELLVSNGADLNAVAASQTRETPLHLASMATIPRPSLVSFLVDRGASVNSMTSEGKTALHLAAERGRDTIFQALLDAGADLTIKIPDDALINGSGDRGKTPLDLARKHPLGALWFDDTGNLQLSVDDKQKGIMTTPIEIETDLDTDDETENSTLVEEEDSQWGSVVSGHVVSIID
ncbi:NACHT and Ankyrin domain protein [Aspergillus tanneri]|uniref:Peptidase A2 domain-containing protein n=1 Tax=Aspergillus tanneri TaxID=1220188 RepID=A0A5M9MKC5_9EURO|nr:uncharacterized protein ATNIH1004_006151 [Aspergillus tanneri]KAA8647458.1 hypothetical protein ATNIH1004_006151 [Aspergillus tanneri]